LRDLRWKRRSDGPKRKPDTILEGGKWKCQKNDMEVPRTNRDTNHLALEREGKQKERKAGSRNTGDIQRGLKRGITSKANGRGGLVPTGNGGA